MTIATIFGALLPVFGLIALGFACGRRAALGPRAFEVLNRFVIAITLPVLTFRTLAHTPAQSLAAPVMIAAVLAGAFATYAIGAFIERRLGRSASEANIAGLSACFSNTGFVGLPIATLAYGPSSLAPVAVSMALYAAVVFGVAVVAADLTDNAGGDVRAAIVRGGGVLLRSPLIVLSVLGLVWSRCDWPLPGPVDTLLATLAGATAPCALVAIGLFIAMPREASTPLPVARIVALKLLLHPALTGAALLLLPAQGALTDRVAILMAAMPAGASSFVLAGRAGQWAMEVSAWAVVLTTCLTPLVVFPLLWWLG